MPAIKPISDMRNRAKEISRLCHETDEPVFITRNGHGDLVVMSQAHYERLRAQIEIYEKLGAADAEAARGLKGIGHKEMFRRLRARVP
jgi:prevent-host-death family protein